MAKHKATRKVLTTPALEWVRQAEKIVKFMEKLKAMPSIHGMKWTRKMIEHYSKQFYAYLEVRPYSCKKQAIRFSERVNIVIAWSIEHD